ncbi:MAG: hypothetical protein HYX21_03430 [Candidatus Yanofskybacteria bacterium]|nr:hypothetical protein [Candidatus Yanofskybacteria bacterium]
MTDRQKQILEELIREYVKGAEPVSSNFLAGKCARLPDGQGFDCSPATIRAEMLNLEKEGFLAQPHTSAGRIPTDKAYRYFVDYLLKEKEEILPEKDRKAIDKTISSASRDPHALSSGLAKTMAGLTDDFVISGIPDTGEFFRVGFSNIFELPEFQETEDVLGLGNMFDEFENYFESFFDKIERNELLVSIGRENPTGEVSNETVIIASYPLPMGYEGISAVIGPMRMAYDRNMALLKYVAKRMNQLR